MPTGWTVIVGTPQWIVANVDKPGQLKQQLRDHIGACGGTFDKFFYEHKKAHQLPIYVLFDVPGQNADQVFDCIDRELGATADRLGDADGA